jgi:hypothetical protein
MTRKEAQALAAEVASEVVLHDLPKRLHRAGFTTLWILALIKATGPPLEAGIMAYLEEYKDLE